MSQDFTIWLEPANNTQEELSRIIKSLASEYDAVPFAPHMTLYSGKTDNLNIIHQAAADIAKHTHEIGLPLDKITASDFFFKTVFLTFHHTDSLIKLNQALSMMPHESVNYQFNPHVSLLYKELPLKEKERIAASICFSHATLVFDKLSVVIPGEGKDWYDIAAWQKIDSFSLYS